MALDARVYASSNLGVRGVEIRKATVDSITYRLNGIHDAKVSIAPLEPDAMLVNLNSMELSIVFGDDYSNIWQGIPRSVDGDANKITFAVEHVASYLRDMFVIDTDKVYAGVEQMNIATQLVTYGQAATYANRGILIGTYSGSGVFRDRTYLAEEYHNVYELIAAFPELDDGFDWDIITASDGTRRFIPYYPSKGSVKANYPLELDTHGQSAFMRGLKKWSESGVNQVTDQMVTGPVDATSGLKLRGRYQASAGTMITYGRKQNVVSESGAVTQTWLDDRAASLALASLAPVVLPDIDIPDSLFGSVWHGDQLPVRVDYGRIQVPRGNYRIAELTVTPAADVLTVKLQP